MYTVMISIYLLIVPFIWHTPTFSWMLIRLSRIAIPLFLRVGGARLETSGREHLEALGDGGYVLVSNHSAFIDPLIIVTAIRDFTLAYVIKKEMRGRPFVGRLLIGLGYLVVDRESPVALKRFQEEVVKRVATGWVPRLGLFPEGTRSRTGKLQKFHIGPFLIASQLGIPILPVVIRGAHAFQPPKQIAVTPGPVAARIHPAIAPPAGKRNPAQMFEDALELQRQTEAIFHAISDFTIIDDAPDQAAA